MRIAILAVTAAILAVGAASGARAAPQQPTILGLPDPERVVQFNVFLPLRDEAALDRLLAEQQDPGSAQYHRWLTPAQFKARFGADPAKMARVRAALEQAGLSVEEHASSFRVTGRVAAVEGVLGARLGMVATAAGTSRIATIAAPQLPAALRDAGATIVAFNPQIPPKHIHARGIEIGPENRYSIAGPYWFDDLKQAYDYPAANAKYKGKLLNGIGATMAVVIDSDVRDSDLNAEFDHENYSSISGLPNPKVLRRRVNGGAPFNKKSGDSFEASLDVQFSLGSAPGATLYLYDIPDLDDDSILAGYIDVDEDNVTDVVSSSFGECELAYSPAWNRGTNFWGVLDVFDAVAKQGNAQGIAWLASSGDSGGLDCPSTNYVTGAPGPYKFVAGVESPADSIYFTAVGGTNMETTTATHSLRSSYASENGYGDPEIPYDVFGLGHKVSGGYWGAGGGVSVHIPKPGYQNLVQTGATMRAVPDIGMQVGGCPAGISKLPCGPRRSAVLIYFGGTLVAVIGTSVSSPEFAGVVALLVEVSGSRVGNMNDIIYRKAAASLGVGGVAHGADYHDAIPGFDGLFHVNAQPKSYSFITGTGTPDVRIFLGLKNVPAAGNPQTPSNP
jgi:subtilase family serine protease